MKNHWMRNLWMKNNRMRHLLSISLALAVMLCFCPLSAFADGKQFVVVLDAGHGGKDPGAIGSSRSNREKDINLDITLQVGRLLKANCPDVKLVYTRSTDKFVELGRRAEIANKAKADLFVSIHTNALPKNAKKAMGVQSYALTLKSASTNLEVEKRENSVIQYEMDGGSKYSYSNPNSSESDIMYELMQDHDIQEGVNFCKIVQHEMVHTAGRRDAGVLQANLAVLRLTYMPSVLLEVGYISTPAEEQYLMSAAGRSALARSIYNGIVKYKAQRTGRQSQTVAVAPVEETAQEEEQPEAVQQEQKAGAAKPKSEKGGADAIGKTAKKTVYKVQVLAGSVKLKANDRQFKGLKCEMHHDGKRYTYTYGNASSMAEAQKIRKSILDKFPEAFVVKFDE